jgi:subtilisin family serine protease
MADMRTPGESDGDDRDIIEALQALGRAETSGPDDLTRQRHLRGMRRARLVRRPSSLVAAAAAVVALVAGVAVFSSDDNNESDQFASTADAQDQARNVSADSNSANASGDATTTTIALPKFDQESPITPIPTDRTEDYVILKVASEHASNVEAQLTSALGDKVPTVGKTDAATTFVVPASVAQQLSDTSGVSSYPDTPVSAVAEQTPTPSWGLDRVDALDTPLDDKYSWTNSGTGSIVYVIDTGVYSAHGDFNGRVVSGYTAIADGRGTEDCHGHGTHVAGTVAGRNYGVAKTATVVAVRVLDCAGSGYSSGVVAGINWVTANHPGGPAVINMSLGGGANSAIDAAVNDAVNAGIVVVVAAGNSAADACSYSPARVPAAITIGATDIRDARASYSNFGSCVDMWAPGTQITSAWISGSSATNTISGTSMASPHVAGLAARVLSMNPALTPTDVNARLVRKNSTSSTPIVNLVETAEDTPVTTTTVVETTTTLPGETTTTAPVESTTTIVAPTTTVVATTTTAPGATTTTIPPSTVPKSPKPGKGRKAVAPKEFSMQWEESEDRPNFFELVASWRIQTAPDRYKITCRQLPLGEKAPIENEIEFDEPTTTKNEEGRTEAKVLLAPAKPLRCELVAIIGGDVSAASNPAIVPPGPRRGVINAPTTTVPNSVTPTTVPGSPTTTAAPVPTPQRPVVTLPKPGNRPTTTTMAPAPTPTAAPPATPAPETTTTVAASTTTAAAAAQPAPQPSSPATTPRNQPSPPATSRSKKG